MRHESYVIASLDYRDCAVPFLPSLAPTLKKQCYDFTTWFVTAIAVPYTMAPFFLLEFGASIAFYRSVGWFGHIAGESMLFKVAYACPPQIPPIPCADICPLKARRHISVSSKSRAACDFNSTNCKHTRGGQIAIEQFSHIAQSLFLAQL